MVRGCNYVYVVVLMVPEGFSVRIYVCCSSVNVNFPYYFGGFFVLVTRCTLAKWSTDLLFEVGRYVMNSIMYHVSCFQLSAIINFLLRKSSSNSKRPNLDCTIPPHFWETVFVLADFSTNVHSRLCHRSLAGYLFGVVGKCATGRRRQCLPIHYNRAFKIYLKNHENRKSKENSCCSS